MINRTTPQPREIYRTATPSPPPAPPPLTASSNDQKVRFELGRSLSCDSSSAASGSVKELDKLSPKLKTFFSFENNPGIQNIDERFPMGSIASSRKFLPTQLLDESTTSDGSSVSNLHNIFSPKFHAQSAKKKRGCKSTGHQQMHRKQQQHHHHSIFSPVSTTSTPGRSYQDANASILSEMSDEFSTIHAILRGDALRDIKKTAVLDDANHPLHSDSGVGSDDSPSNVDEYPRDQQREDVLESNPENHNTNVDSSNRYVMQYDDDSTEVMLGMARFLTSEGQKNS